MFKVSLIELMLSWCLIASFEQSLNFTLLFPVSTFGRYKPAGIHPEVFWKVAVLKISENSQGSYENSSGKVSSVALETKP